MQAHPATVTASRRPFIPNIVSAAILFVNLGVTSFAAFLVISLMWDPRGGGWIGGIFLALWLQAELCLLFLPSAFAMYSACRSWMDARSKLALIAVIAGVLVIVLTVAMFVVARRASAIRDSWYEADASHTAAHPSPYDAPHYHGSRLIPFALEAPVDDDNLHPR